LLLLSKKMNEKRSQLKLSKYTSIAQIYNPFDQYLLLPSFIKLMGNPLTSISLIND